MFKSNISWLNKYIGLKFKDHARGPKSFDCYGLYWFIRKNEFNDNNIPSYDDKYNSYFEKHVKKLMDNEERYWIKIEYHLRKIGDLIKIKVIMNNKLSWHVGMILDSNYMIHIMKGIDSCVEQYTSKAWERKIFGIYRPNYKR